MLVTFQQLLPETLTDGAPEWWEAEWYDPRTRTAGFLSSAEPMAGGAFGSVVKREVRRMQSVPPLHTVIDGQVENERVGAYPRHGLDFGTAGGKDVAAYVAGNALYGKVTGQAQPASPPPPQPPAPPSPPQAWDDAPHTEREDHAQAKNRARARREVRCRWCGRVTGSLSQSCTVPACILKRARGKR